MKYHCTVDLLFDWFGICCMTTDNFCFYLQNRLIQTSQTGGQWFRDTVFYQVQCTLFYIENVAELFPAHYTWKVSEKGFKMAFMMNKLAMINTC